MYPKHGTAPFSSAGSTPVRRTVVIDTTPHPVTGAHEDVIRSVRTIALSPEGSIDEQVGWTRYRGCGCATERPVGGSCIVCGAMVCAAHLGHCATCFAPLCLQHSRHLDGGNGQPMRVCPSCSLQVRRSRLLGAIWRNLVRLFVISEGAR